MGKQQVRMHRSAAGIIFGLAAIGLAACSQSAPTSEATSDTSPTTLFLNADILTMNDMAPRADALAIRDGKILAVGDRASVETAAGEAATVRYMTGKTILPGLIDAHGHFLGGALAVSMADVQPPPAGAVQNMKELTETLEAWRLSNLESPWIYGFGYDDSLLAEQRHPTREDLDKVSRDLPVMLLHVSGHFVTCNSKCLEIAGINAETPNPPGGVIRRIPGTQEADGVLEETALQVVMAQLPRPTPEQMLAAIEVSQEHYLSLGITTAQEGAAAMNLMESYAAMADAGKLKMDVVVYPAVRSVTDFDPTFTSSNTYENHYRVGGIKLILDGSPQGKTAWLTHPYHSAPEGRDADYVGYPTMVSEDVNTILDDAFARDTQVIAHANGDAAADQLIAGVEAAIEANGVQDRRTVMIHAQTVRDDQIAAMKRDGVIPSYFVAHTFFWGDWHRDSVLGQERSARISPLKTSLDADLLFTIHNDAPVIPPDMMRLVWTAVNRETRSGKILGPDERISPMEALKAVTINGAYQYFEEDSKGSLEVGKRADLVILSDDPTAIAPGAIKDIAILETIKDGVSVFVAQ